VGTPSIRLVHPLPQFTSFCPLLVTSHFECKLGPSAPGRGWWSPSARAPYAPFKTERPPPPLLLAPNKCFFPAQFPPFSFSFFPYCFRYRMPSALLPLLAIWPHIIHGNGVGMATAKCGDELTHFSWQLTSSLDHPILNSVAPLIYPLYLAIQIWKNIKTRK